MNMINITTIRKRMTKGMLLMVLFLAQTVISSAQVKLYIEDFSVSRADITSAEGKAVSLVLENDVVATQVQVTVDLPEGLAYVPNSAKKTSRVKSGDAYVDASTATGKLVILGTDVNVAAGNGAIITFNVRPDATLKDGDHQIKLTEIVVSDENANQLNTIKESTSKVTMLSLGSCKIEGPELLQAAVNEEYQIDIVLNNEGVDNVAAVSGTVTLPAGMEFVEGEDGKFIRSDRAQSPLSFKVKDFEGYTNFVLSSNRNTVITGSNGVLFSFKVKADATLAENTVIKLSELRVADTDGKSAALDDVEISVKFDVLGAAKYVLTNTLAEAKKVDTTGMTAESVQALNDAIAAAEAALAAETATVESLNAAKTDVEAAVAGLVVAPLFADGKYYIYNNGVQKYLAAGASWGTHAVVNATGLDYTLTLADGKYTMDSQVSNGGNKHFLNGEWNDGDAMGWTFEAVEGKEGVYTISNGTQFLTAQENGEVLLKEDATVEAAQWTLKTVEARVAELAAATAEAPVDASFLIADANFGRNDLRKSAWTTEASNLNMSGGNNTNNCAESYHSVFSLSQTLTNLPKGVYALTAQGFYRQDGQDNDNLPVFFANNEAITFPAKTGSENNMSQASESFTAGNYTIAPIYVQVAEDGQLTVGAKLEENTALWCIWDNFQLTYYGADADIEQLKNAAIIAELAALRKQLAEKKDQVEVEVVKTEAENALTATADVTGTDAINAAVETLKAALDKVEASLDAKAKLANMKELVDATNVYTAEAKNEYYDQWVVKYNDGTITKAEANALQDPFIVTGWHANITVDNFLLSAWDTNPDFQNAPYYINSWSIEGESDGSNFKVPFFEYWTNDDSSLGEKTLTATMNGLEAGEYNVTAWVRVRMKNGAEAPATGVKLQANDGEAVDVCDGEAFGPMYVKEVAATGTVAEDGVLKIKFNVAADNNVSWLSFKNVKFEKKAVEIAHTWDFTKWSEATVANLKADAAASKIEGWSDVEKKADAEAGNDAPEATKDNCFWAVIAEGGELTANGEVIEELKGLQFGATFAGNRSLAIAVNYPTTSLGTYAGPAYLWLGGKNFECFTIPAVKGGTTIKMGVESHKPTDARGVQLFAGETELKDADGNAVAAPKTYTEQTWVVPAGVAYDIVVKNTNGCHIYFIDAEQDENTLTSINTVKSNVMNNAIYNLNGQKVNKAQKGLFIINGKKVVK